MDLKNTGLIKLKGALFFLIAVLASGLLLRRDPEWTSAFLLAVALWAACRCYYFAFYVLHHYVDPSFRYAGIGALLRHLLRSRKANETASLPSSPDDRPVP
jgi:hypothetical protein